MSWKLPRKIENGLFVVWLICTAGALLFSYLFGNDNTSALNAARLPELIIFMVPILISSIAFGCLYESALDRSSYGRWRRILGMSMLITALSNIFVQWWNVIPFGGIATLALGAVGLFVAIWDE